MSLPLPRLSLHRTVVLILALAAVPLAAPAATLPTGFTETLVAEGLDSPTAMAFAPDGRLFVCSQGGDVRVIKDGVLLPDPFVSLNVDDRGERGLLGIAFDPAFADNHLVYLYYTVPGGTRNRISRFTADGDVAVPASEEIVLGLDPLNATNHNGGAIHFGPDGKLYVAVGENAEEANSQSLETLLGKILRINGDGTIPGDNPFIGQTTGNRRAIWALGLRNPFTFAFQPGSGRMFINDVGASTREEINDGIAGSNYGWPESEGPTSNPDHRGPLFSYLHGTGVSRGCAITGGAFYNPEVVQFPDSYVGAYFFADLCSGWIRRFNPATRTAAQFARGIDMPVDLQVGPDGRLYYLDYGTSSVWRIQFGDGAPNDPPTATITEPGSGASYDAGETVDYAGTGSDPEDGALPAGAFTWRVEFHHGVETDVVVPATTGSTSGSFTIPDTGETSTDVFYRIVLTVRDSGGLTSTASRDLVPNLATLELATDPPGLQVTLDGQVITTPAEVDSVVGMRRVLSPVSPQTSGGTSYSFASWSDGGAATHTLVTPASDTIFTATYVDAPPAGVGLAGFYYNNTAFTGTVRTRLDPAVDFTWTGAPIDGIGADTFSVRWTGQVRAKVTGTHTFRTTTDGGVRLFVDGAPVIRHYASHPTADDTGTIDLVAGQMYDVRLEYFDNAGTAVARLLWSGPGLPEEVVPRESLYPYALFVVGEASLGVDDAAVRDRLVAGGFVPVLRTGAAVTATDATRKAVVVVSSTVSPAEVGQAFRTSPTPVVVWEAALFPKLALTGAAATAFGTESGQTQIAITEPGHPLAAGLSGAVAVTSAPATLSWGVPSAGAVVVARPAGNPARASLFAYERGALMVGLRAPARRVGFFLHDATPSLLTPAGQSLLDAALRWATGP